VSTLIAPASFAIVTTTVTRTNSWTASGIEAVPDKNSSTVSFGDLANITATGERLAAQLPIKKCDPCGRSINPYIELPGQCWTATAITSYLIFLVRMLVQIALIKKYPKHQLSKPMTSGQWILSLGWRCSTLCSSAKSLVKLPIDFPDSADHGIIND
jgi:hypothetical protein